LTAEWLRGWISGGEWDAIVSATEREGGIASAVRSGERESNVSAAAGCCPAAFVVACYALSPLPEVEVPVELVDALEEESLEEERTAGLPFVFL